MIRFPTINTPPACPPGQPSGNCPDSDGSTTDGGGNPIPPPNLSLLLKPSTALICATTTTTIAAFTSLNGSEQKISSGVVFTSGDTSIATVDSNGTVTGISAGIVTITGKWQGLTAFAQVNVVGTGAGCCEGVKVAMWVALDNTFSMSLPFSGSYATKYDYARALARDFMGTLNASKDMMGYNDFTQPTAVVPLTSDIATLQAAVDATPQGGAQYGTSLYEGMKSGLEQLNGATADMKVLIVISDGDYNSTGSTLPSPEGEEYLAQFFKNAGILIISVGVRAASYGYDVLNNVSSPGYFLNALPDNAGDVFDYLSGLKGYFCAGSCNVYDGNGQGCLATPPPEQVPDPSPQLDNETGQSQPPPPPPPPLRLPPVTFAPASGAAIGSGGQNVVLSVLGHPTASIRYVYGTTAEPADPSFTFPSSPNYGIDYDGANAPVPLPGYAAAGQIWLKAVARLSGYQDSVVSEAIYPTANSNNTSPITIPAFQGQAAPYPSVQVVSGKTGLVTGVTLNINGFQDNYCRQVCVLLRSPSGRTAVIFCGAGGPHTIVSPVNLVFDDTAGSTLPNFNTPVSGTFKCSPYGVIISNVLPAPAYAQQNYWPPDAPQPNYGLDLATFIGDEPNGPWSLWVASAANVDSGVIASWAVNITSA